MAFRLNLVGVCTISVIFILSLLASYRFTSTSFTTEYFRPREGAALLRNTKNYKSYNNYYKHRYQDGGGGANGFMAPENATILIEDILNYQREKVTEEMLYFEYPDGKHGVRARKLSDLTPELGGKPMRSIIFTTWRSGSTFLGDILNAMPGNFYHYEPLLHYEIVQIRGAPYAGKALEHLRKLLTCNYTDMEDYLNYGKEHNNLFTHNTRLWKHCRLFTNYCFIPKFLEPFCKLFPLQSMKVVRLRAALAQVLLDDPTLNVRIILLIRDPRGTMQSRRHRDWCPGQPDCDHVPTVCADMVADYHAARNLTRLYPDRFHVIRYEDLSLNPYDMTNRILAFYGLPMDEQVQDFLDSHTKLNIGGVSSTFRDSKSAPFHWTKELDFDDVAQIQDQCTEAMKLWGYKPVNDPDELHNNFNPLLDFKLSAAPTKSS
ncbi:carbohydrate sulfotransferase 5 [Culicoides brevitarsis]|uniref:carbohydrate sulfotransferase 5 n=1 Tax=Culicoides brevitarsis TaxID=469753 RepID=UPI00307BBD9E